MLIRTSCALLHHTDPPCNYKTMGAPAVPSGTARSAMSIATPDGRPSLHKNQTMKSRSRTSLSATASFLRVQLRVGRLMQPDTTVLVPQSSVPQLGSTGVAGTLGHGTKIRYISFPDVHNLYSSLPEPKLLDHGTKIRYISVPEVPTRYRTKKYLLGTKFCVADRIKLWRIDIRYLHGSAAVRPRSGPARLEAEMATSA